jgi:hypothetical protein
MQTQPWQNSQESFFDNSCSNVHFFVQSPFDTEASASVADWRRQQAKNAVSVQVDFVLRNAPTIHVPDSPRKPPRRRRGKVSRRAVFALIGRSHPGSARACNFDYRQAPLEHLAVLDYRRRASVAH